MSLINIGTTPNDGTGDPLRTAFDKINKTTSTRVFTTSGAGAVDDADISLGSSTFGTDSYDAIQGLLDEAANGPIMIIWDGRYSANQALTIWSNTTIIALPGCGVILRDDAPAGAGTSGRLMQNKNLVTSSASGGYGSNIVDENIVIDGMIINGNAPGQNWVNHCITFRGVRNLKIVNCTLYAGDRFMLNTNNIEHLSLINNKLDHGAIIATTNNHDGYHFDGYHRWITVDGFDVQNCDDDVIALMPGTSGAQGPITDVVIRNMTLHGTDHGVRFGPGGTGFNIQRVLVDGVFGVTGTRVVTFNAFDGTSGYCEDVRVTNLDVEIASGRCVYIASGNFRNITIDGFFRGEASGAFVAVDITGGLTNNLKICNFQGRYSSASPVVNCTGGTVQRLQIINSYHQSVTGSNLDCELVSLNGGTINTIEISNYTAPRINRLIELLAGTCDEVIVSNIHVPHIVTTFFTNITVANLQASNVLGGAVSTLIGGSGAFTTKRGSSLDYLGPILFANLPAAATYPGSEAYVTDEADGATKAFSDGTNWISVKDGAAVTGP